MFIYRIFTELALQTDILHVAFYTINTIMVKSITACLKQRQSFIIRQMLNFSQLKSNYSVK